MSIPRIIIVPSGRIDYCSTCKADHGYKCPKDPSSTKPDKTPAQKKQYEIMRSKRGEGTPRWKGDNAKMDSFHIWLNRNYGRPTYCENKDCPRISTTFEWCLKRGEKYSHNHNSYLWLCRSCHRKYDQTPERLAQLMKNLVWYKKFSAMEPEERARLKSLNLCTKCKEKPKLKWSKSYCKECYNQIDKARYYKNREKRLEKDRKNYQKNKLNK